MYFKKVYSGESVLGLGEVVGGEAVIGAGAALYVVVEGDHYFLSETPILGTFSAATGLETEEELLAAEVEEGEYFDLPLEGVLTLLPDFDTASFDVTAKGNTLAR